MKNSYFIKIIFDSEIRFDIEGMKFILEKKIVHVGT